jgi:uncharacterized phiE125 gp8 family phage protein
VYCSRSFIATVWDYFLDSSPIGGGYWNRSVRTQGPDPSNPQWLPGYAPIQLTRAPLLSVQSITYLDGRGISQGLDLATVRVSLGSPGSIFPAYGKAWPNTLPVNDAIVVRYTAGYGATADTVPESIKAAIKLCVGHLYENREAVGVLTFSELPLGVSALLGINEYGAQYA